MIRAPSASSRPKYVFQHAHPSAHFTTPWYFCSHRLQVSHRFHLAINTLSPKLFSSASATKIFACSARHDTCAKPAVPRHAHPRTRPSFVFQCRACVQMKHVCPFVSSAHFSTATATASAYFVFALYCSAPPAFFIFLQRLSWPPSFQCCTWHSAPHSVCCSGRISCPRL